MISAILICQILMVILANCQAKEIPLKIMRGAQIGSLRQGLLNRDKTFKLNRNKWQNYQVQGTQIDRVAKKLNKSLEKMVSKKYRLGQSVGFELELVNKNNFMVYGEISVGSENQQVNLVFDTASDWITIKNESFDPDTSGSYTNISEEDVSFRNYGGLTVHGADSTDKICIEDSCVADFDFFLAESESQQQLPMDGVFGLSRDINVGDFVAGPLLIKALQSTGAIDYPVFTFQLYTEKQQEDETLRSSIEFGTYTDYIDLRTIQLQQNFFWLASCSGIQLNGDSFSFYDEDDMILEYKMIFDSGTSMTYVPSSLAEKFFERLVGDDIQITDFQGYQLVECDEPDFESVFLLVAGNWLEMKPKDYLLPVEGGACLIGFVANKDDFWVLGLNFFFDYYMVFDMQKGQVKIAPGKHSNKQTVPTGIEQPEDDIYKKPNIFFRILGWIWNVIVTILYYMFYFFVWLLENSEPAPEETDTGEECAEGDEECEAAAEEAAEDDDLSWQWEWTTD